MDPWGAYAAVAIVYANPAFYTNPIGWAVLGITGLTIVGYGIYESLFADDIGAGVCYYEPAPSLDEVKKHFPNAEKVRRKGPRTRWKDTKSGDIIEWDSLHGEYEIYNKRGKHKGAFNPKTGKWKPPVPGRKIKR